jgi:hypothetical protein
MTKNGKELIVVLLAGAGVITAMWGYFATRQVGFVIIHQSDWKVVGIGAGLLALAVLLGILLKTKK